LEKDKVLPYIKHYILNKAILAKVFEIILIYFCLGIKIPCIIKFYAGENILNY